jgi:UDP-glucose 4-epimerase
MMSNLRGKSVLVTGGAGFIGSHLVDRIIQESPDKLIVVDNLFLGKMGNLDNAQCAYPTLKFFQQDAANYEKMKHILIDEGVEVIFNLAVVPLPTSLERPRWTVDVNVAITTVACELLREGYYQTLIHFSSSEVYGSAQYIPMDEKHQLLPSTPYAASKSASDHIVLSYWKTFGVDVAIIRPFNNYGPRQNEGIYAGVIPIVIQRVLNGNPVVIYGDGEQTRDFIFVHEVADAAVKVYEYSTTRGKVINIASGEEVSINHLVSVLTEILNTDVRIVYGAPRPGDVRRHFGAIGLAQKIIGFQPKTGLKSGLEETVLYYRNRLETLDGDNVR